MIFHENRLLTDDSHEISYLIFFRKLEKMSQNLLSDAVVIGALRDKVTLPKRIMVFVKVCLLKCESVIIIMFLKSCNFVSAILNQRRN